MKVFLDAIDDQLQVLQQNGLVTSFYPAYYIEDGYNAAVDVQFTATVAQKLRLLPDIFYRLYSYKMFNSEISFVYFLTEEGSVRKIIPLLNTKRYPQSLTDLFDALTEYRSYAVGEQ